MAFVYVDGTLSANHHARPLTNPLPFAETYGNQVKPAPHAILEGRAYQVTHDPSVESRNGDTEQRTEHEEKCMQGEEEPFFSGPPVDCLELQQDPGRGSGGLT